MVTFYALLRGEDGLEFVADHECTNALDMHGWVEEHYPEARIIDIYSQQTLDRRDAERYNRLADELDSGVYND